MTVRMTSGPHVIGAVTPVRHRAIPVTMDLGDFTDPQEPEESTADILEPMKDGSDPAAIVISRRTLGWAAAALFTLFSGGQIASLKLVGDDGPDPQTTALSGRVDQLSAKVDQMSASGEARDQHFSRVLNAVLIYFLEVEREGRSARRSDSPARSPELEQAAQRLRDLATP